VGEEFFTSVASYRNHGKTTGDRRDKVLRDCRGNHRVHGRGPVLKAGIWIVIAGKAGGKGREIVARRVSQREWRGKSVGLIRRLFWHL
jgi:hypothetical protein